MVQCDAGSGSQMIDVACDCHLLVEDATVETSQYGTSIKAKFLVIGSTDPQQVGKSVTEFFSCGGKAVDKLYNLAEAVGMITGKQRKAAAEGGVGLEIDETLFKGRQLCGRIELESKVVQDANGKYIPDPASSTTYPRLGFRTFAVDSAKAKDIPKDQQQQTTQQQPPAAAAEDLDMNF